MSLIRLLFNLASLPTRRLSNRMAPPSFTWVSQTKPTLIKSTILYLTRIYRSLVTHKRILLTKTRDLYISTLRRLTITFKTSNCIKAPLTDRRTSCELTSPPHNQATLFSSRLKWSDPLRPSDMVKANTVLSSTLTCAALTLVRSLQASLSRS